MIGNADPENTKASDGDVTANGIRSGRAPIWDSAVIFMGGMAERGIYTGTTHQSPELLERR